MAKHVIFDQYIEHEGVPYNETLSPLANIIAVKAYEDIRDDDVIVWTYPKAGTHWVADMVNKIVRKGNIEEADRNKPDANFMEISIPKELAVAALKMDAVPTMLLQSLADHSALPSPRVMMSHLRYHLLPLKVQEGKAKVIYVFRDPRDMTVSFFHHFTTGKKIMSQMTGIEQPAATWSEFLDATLTGDVPYGTWWDHYRSFQDNRDKPNVLNLFYEDMKKDLKGTVSKIAGFLGVSLSDDVIRLIGTSCTFESAKSASPNYLIVRKGATGDWKNLFTVAQSEAFDAKLKEVKESLNLDMPYAPYAETTSVSSLVTCLKKSSLE